ncbi:hypothetical protein Y032_0109g115 [Ancylostoma ceylanicum]|uniref:Uncharacterized protein n=1 Tax=Ancylostoma ceylanicum TaxID=53326 RepID=A0A016TER3_9BILA|nr:hypothetical protein Y032_0109g115 [Ancylostoma ceylanicum]
MLRLQGSAPRRKRNLADICENLPPVPFELKRSRTLNDRPVSTEGRSPAPEQVDSSEEYDSDGQHETMSAVLEAKNRHAGHMRVSRAYATTRLAKVLTFPYVDYDPLH